MADVADAAVIQEADAAMSTPAQLSLLTQT